MDHEMNFMEDTLAYFDPSMMDEMDDSLLELLCEDGFLELEEIAEAETQEEQEALIRLAIERGFPGDWDEESLDTAVKLIVKKLDSLRIWKDLADDDLHLRAPPVFYAG